VSDEYKDKDGLGVDEDANTPSKEGQAGQSEQTMVYGDDEEEEEEKKGAAPKRHRAQTMVCEDDDDDEEEEPAKDQQAFTRQRYKAKSTTHGLRE